MISYCTQNKTPTLYCPTRLSTYTLSHESFHHSPLFPSSVKHVKLLLTSDSLPIVFLLLRHALPILLLFLECLYLQLWHGMVLHPLGLGMSFPQTGLPFLFYPIILSGVLFFPNSCTSYYLYTVRILIRSHTFHSFNECLLGT